MTKLNPHWDLTDQPRQDAPANSKTLPSAALAVPRGSPRPAAIFGVLLAVGVGLFAAVGNGWILQGQAVPSAVLEVTAAGFSPTSLTVRAGDRVALRNSDTVAHTVTLMNPIPDREPLFSVMLQPRRAGVATITENMPAGTYFLSTTDAIPFVGQVIIEEGGAPAAAASSTADGILQPPASSSRPAGFGPAGSASSAPAVSPLRPSAPTAASSSAPVVPPASVISGSPIASTPTGGQADPTPFTIEVNPYAIETMRGAAPMMPSSDTGRIVPLGQVGNAGLHSGAPLAPSIPKSGPELWIVGALALGGFWLAIRRGLRVE
ncbi:MAG: hypothetical protein KBC95_00240 [Candidatus Peribacteraceae bacterium]|nr:hypothetical protein [Candidatus Peribacteraceae bacterium]